MPTKQAGTTADERSFETALSQLAYTQVAAKAPSLFDDALGFQVLDANDKKTKAVGVFGFRPGNKLLYVPVFYQDGRVDGTEILIVAKGNLVVPNTDNWVNYLTVKAKNDVGKPVDRVRAREALAPNFWQIKDRPTKYAEAEPAIRVLAAAFAGKSLGGYDGPGLMETLAGAPKMAAAFLDWTEDYPWLKAAVASFYGPGAVADVRLKAEKTAAELAYRRSAAARVLGDVKVAAPKAPPTHAPALSIVRVRSVRLTVLPASGLDFPPAALDELRNGRNWYEDTRSDQEVTRPQAWDRGGEMVVPVANPTTSGVYEVAVGPGEFSRCAVITGLDAPLGLDDDPGRCLVVRLSDGATADTNRSKVYAAGTADDGAYRDWVRSLPKLTATPPAGAPIVAVTNTGHGVVPVWPYGAVDGPAMPAGQFEAHETQAEPSARWYPRKKPYQYGAPPWDQGRLTSWHERGPRTQDNSGPIRVVLTGRPNTKPYVSGRTVYLPDDTRYVAVDRKARLPIHTPSTGPTIHAYKKADPDLKWVRVTAATGRVVVADPRTGKEAVYAFPEDAEAHLVVDHGFRPADARRLTAAAVEKTAAEVGVKYGSPYLYQQDGPAAPAVPDSIAADMTGMFGNVVPARGGYSMAVPVRGASASRGELSRYRAFPADAGSLVDLPGIGNAGRQPKRQGPDPRDLKVIHEAARSGRRQIFETAALAALLKQTPMSAVVDRPLPKMLQEVTALGNKLIHSYWNVDAWNGRYGDTQVPQIRDRIRGLFEELGDLFLTLRETDADRGQDDTILPDLSEDEGGDEPG